MENQNLTNNLNFHYRVKVLMISLDRGLLGKGELGDVSSRHREYGKFVEKLDIIVFSRAGFNKNQISETVAAYPTNSKSKFGYLCDAYRIGKKLFAENQYQLLATQAPFISGLVGYFLAKKYQAKLLIHFHGDYINNKEWLKEKWYNFLLVPISKFLSKKADGIRVMSQGIKDKLVASGISENKIRVISTPVSLVKFGNWSNGKVEELKNQYQGKKIILFIGRLEAVKDLPTLLKGLKEVTKIDSSFVLLVIGSGSLANDWQNLAREEGLDDQVKFLGQLEHEDLVNYYAASEFVVNSSTSESFGKIFVEAAACGKPAVATATTGAKEIIINGQTGFLSPVGENSSLAANILKFLADEKLAKQFGQRAKESVAKRFDGGINTAEIIKFWQELIENKKRP
ncbi:MAG: glycosyltransferase [Patescibacteria group bacterium]|jgi:glycosyltransferase involved in cell wall biosynthesis